MARDFSLIRRGLHWVEITIPRSDGIVSYDLATSPTFDGTFTPRILIPPAGYVAPSILSSGLLDSRGYSRPSINEVKGIFDTSDFTTPSVDPSQSFWLQLTPTPSPGPGTAGPPRLVVPNMSFSQPCSIKGTAPNGADISESLELQLPSSMLGVSIINLDSSADLMVAFNGSESEILIPKGASYSDSFISVFSMAIRGASATAAMEAVFSYPRPGAY